MDRIFRVLVLLAPAILSAQTEGRMLTFEVASIKPAAPMSGPFPDRFLMRGGPGTPDPGQLTYTNVSMQQLLITAYGLGRPYRLSGPNGLDHEKYDIVAKVPAGATHEQVNAMLQNLLVERFQLAFHREMRDLQGYEITVAKSGPKVKESTDTTPVTAPQPGPNGVPVLQTTKGKDGQRELPSGFAGILITMAGPGMPRYMAKRQPISKLADVLENPLGRPVVDKSGLTGTYDFTLTFTRDDRTSANSSGSATSEPSPDASPDLFTAMQEQLGLKLDAKKIPIEVLVVDHVEKGPIAN